MRRIEGRWKAWSPAQWSARVALGIAVLIGAGLMRSAGAEDATDGSLVQCTSLVSFDKRLRLQQWAVSGQCSRPVGTRVTDHFLGYTCLQSSPEVIRCRSFVPRLDSRALDTAKGFRCVEVSVTGDDGDVAVSRLREWSSAPKQCEWDPYADVLAMEVDFEHSQVCLAAFCLPIDRLSVIGATRLRRLITSAFEELHLTAQGPASKAVHPARSGQE